MSPATATRELSNALDGEVTLPGDPGYDDARSLYNAMIDKHPAVIARCADVHDVQLAPGHAQEQGLSLAVRGGGHSIAGHSSIDGGLVVDLSLMKDFWSTRPSHRECPARRPPRQVDAATQEFGLAVPAGTISHTGIAGLTLGGGTGWLMRKHGLTIDNLLAAEIVPADGVVAGRADEHPDLFWGSVAAAGTSAWSSPSSTGASGEDGGSEARPSGRSSRDRRRARSQYQRAHRRIRRPRSSAAFFAFHDRTAGHPPFPAALHGQEGPRPSCGVTKRTPRTPSIVEVRRAASSPEVPPLLHGPGQSCRIPPSSPSSIRSIRRGTSGTGAETSWGGSRTRRSRPMRSGGRQHADAAIEHAPLSGERRGGPGRGGRDRVPATEARSGLRGNRRRQSESGESTACSATLDGRLPRRGSTATRWARRT